MNRMTLQREETVLVLIDIQERLMSGMNDGDAMEKAVVKLVKGCRVLDVPILVTQQYTKGLGPTAAAVAEALTGATDDQTTAGGQTAPFSPIEKTSFSAMREPEFVQALEETGRRSVVIVGVEAHVCVLQTAIHLIETGYDVFVALDCIASRKVADKETGQIRMAQSGVIVTGCETILFELLGDAKDPCFKQISAIVK